MATVKTQAALGLLLDVIQKVDKSVKDGFKFTDIFSFVSDFSQVPDILSTKQDLINELKALTSSDIQTLVSFINTNLNLNDKNTQAIIESSLGVVLSILNLVGKLKGAPAVITTTSATTIKQ